MCELEPPVPTVPDAFISGLELKVESVGIKHPQKDIIWEFIDRLSN